MSQHKGDVGQRQQARCNVNSTFNFTVGGIAIVAALLVGYLVYAYWWR